MPRTRIERLRDCIRRGHYDLTFHAVEEMAEDFLDIFDIEMAIITGEIVRIERDDPRGTRYVVQGTGYNGQTPVGVVGRLVEGPRLLVITVYEVT